MQITTINVNGIRAATKIRSSTNRGFLPWLFDVAPDVVLLQETRATDAESRTALAPALDAGWHFYSAPSIRKGHAGVGILSRRELVDVRVGLAGFEDVGRYIQGTYPDDDGDVIIASLYLPVGGAGSEKQDEKYEFLDAFDQVISDTEIQNSHMVIGGDWNICHREQDLKNYQANRKNSGCLPDERAFMDHMFGTYPDSQSQVVGAGEWYGAVNYRSKKRRQAPKLRNGMTWRDASAPTTPPTPGGPIAAAPSATMPGGASTTKPQPNPCSNGRRRCGSTRPPTMPPAGATTHPSPCGISESSICKNLAESPPNGVN